MTDNKNNYQLTSNVPQFDSRLITNLQEFLDFLPEMKRAHTHYLANLQQDPIDNLSQPIEIGFSCFLTKSVDNVALVGISSRGWIIHRMEPLPFKTTRKHGKGDLVAILLPEWTEYLEGELISREKAIEILRQWFEDAENRPVF